MVTTTRKAASARRLGGRRAADANEELLAAPRGPLRRLAHCWGVTPGIAAPHDDVEVFTADGVRLSGSYLPGPAAGVARTEVPAVVLAPGFAGHRTKPAYALLAERLSARAAVLSLDLRGHGGSGGRCTFGAREGFDVAAAGAWLRRRGHRWVGAVGSSMGGTAVLRAAGLAPPGLFDAVCAISAPAVWGSPSGAGGQAHGVADVPVLEETPAMRDIRRTITVAWYRALVGAVLHVRIAPSVWTGEDRSPRAPLEVVGRIAPVPLLLVHGEDDHYFSAEQAQLLHGAAGEPRTLWREPPGFGHAEDGFRRPFGDRLATAVAEVAASHRWPSR